MDDSNYTGNTGNVTQQRIESNDFCEVQILNLPTKKSLPLNENSNHSGILQSKNVKNNNSVNRGKLS